MNSNPFQLDITLLPNQKKLRVAAWVLLEILILGTLIMYTSLPDEIPTHFNAQGEADAYGSKNSVWFILGAFVFMNLLLYIILQYPRYINYPVKVTPENAQKQYYNVVDMTMTLNILINVIGLIILFTSVNYDLASKLHLNKSLGFLTILCFVVVIYYLLKGYRNA